MGFFDFFKKRTPSHSEKMNLAYRCYKPETVEMIFPGGIGQAEKVLLSLSKIYRINLEASDAKKYYGILSTYSDVVIRRIVTQSTGDHILTVLQTKHPDLVKDKATAEKALAYVTMNMANNDFVLETGDDSETLALVNDMFTAVEEMAAKKAAAETAYLNDPEYGLVLNKPVYTRGVRGSEKYLQSLQTVLGEPLTWQRSLSIDVDDEVGIVDVYESTLPSGKPYKTLYISIYGSADPATIPKGFRKKG